MNFRTNQIVRIESRESLERGVHRVVIIPFLASLMNTYYSGSVDTPHPYTQADIIKGFKRYSPFV
jgi:hypothetical protein